MPNWWHDKSKPPNSRGLYRATLVLQQTPQPPWGSISTPPILAEQSRRQTRHPARPRPDKMIATLLRGTTSVSTPMARARRVHQYRPQGAPFDPALAREFFAKAGFTRPDRMASCETTRTSPLPQHHLPHGGTCPASHPAAGRGEKGGAQPRAQSDGCVCRLPSMLEKNTRVPGWPGAVVAIPPIGNTSTGVNTSKPQTNNIMNIDDDRIRPWWSNATKAFDFGKRPTSRQIQQRLYELASFVPALSGALCPGRRLALDTPAQGAGNPRATCSLLALDGSTRVTALAACSGLTRSGKGAGPGRHQRGRPSPPVTITDTTYQQKIGAGTVSPNKDPAHWRGLFTTRMAPGRGAQPRLACFCAMASATSAGSSTMPS